LRFCRHVFAGSANGQFGTFATRDENGHGRVLGVRARLAVW
jgi:hypothetical protein